VRRERIATRAEQTPFASPQALGVDVGAIKRFHPVFSLVVGGFVTRCHRIDARLHVWTVSGDWAVL
jgi:hypothetical protein